MPSHSGTIRRTAFVALFVLIPSAGFAQPYVELGLAGAGDIGRSMTPLGGGTGSTFMSPRIELGYWPTRTIGIGVSADVGTELDFEGQSAYSLVTPIAQWTPLPTRAIRLRAGAGWAATQLGSTEKGEGLVGRVGIGLDLPPSTLISVTFTGDFVAGLTGSYHRISTYPPGDPRNSFDFRVLQLGLGLHLGR